MVYSLGKDEIFTKFENKNFSIFTKFSDEITRMKSKDEENLQQGPAVDKDELIKLKATQDAKNLLEAYWQFVKDNPHDFQGWTYLLQHVENIDILDEIRTAYNKFLALYRYW